MIVLPFITLCYILYITFPLTVQIYNSLIFNISHTYITGTWRQRQIDRLLGNSATAIHTFPRHHDETGPIHSHPSLLTFTDNRNEPDRADESFDRLWKITRPVWNSKCHIFHILEPFRKSGYWRSFCLFQGKGDFQTARTKQMQAFRHQNFQTLWLDWIYVWHESILGEGQTAHGTALNSNPCDSDRTDQEDRRTWPQIIHGQFLFFPRTTWWLGQETDLLLWQCQAEQERHATRPSTKDNKTEKRGHSSKNQGWLDDNTVAGQGRRLHVDE